MLFAHFYVHVCIYFTHAAREATFLIRNYLNLFGLKLNALHAMSDSSERLA